MKQHQELGKQGDAPSRLKHQVSADSVQQQKGHQFALHRLATGPRRNYTSAVDYLSTSGQPSGITPFKACTGDPRNADTIIYANARPPGSFAAETASTAEHRVERLDIVSWIPTQLHLRSSTNIGSLGVGGCPNTRYQKL